MDNATWTIQKFWQFLYSYAHVTYRIRIVVTFCDNLMLPMYLAWLFGGRHLLIHKYALHIFAQYFTASCSIIIHFYARWEQCGYLVPSEDANSCASTTFCQHPSTWAEWWTLAEGWHLGHLGFQVLFHLHCILYLVARVIIVVVHEDEDGEWG